MSRTSRNLNGRVAIVTASSNGIGLAIARRLAQDGAAVTVSSRKQQNVDQAVNQLKQEGLNVHGVVCHVANAEQRQNLLKQTVEKFGGIDILVSNAAINPAVQPILDTTEAVWDKIFEVNVKAGFLLCKEVVPYMEKRGGGSVVFVSSAAGYRTEELTGPYSVTKTALIGLTKALTPQLARMNIRVNGIAPALIRTSFSKVLVDSLGDTTAQQYPIGRIGEPEDCADVVSFLVSDDARFVAGETIIISGGLNARL